MKTLLRTTLTALLAVAGGGSPSPALLAQDTPSVRLPAIDWDILVRPRVGVFMPQWDYAAERRLPRRPTAGIEVLVRGRNAWFGTRLLAERTGAWQAGDLADWGSNGADVLARPPERVGTVVVNALLYGPGNEDARPYLFVGGGSRSITLGNDLGGFADPGASYTRAATLHGGIGVEARIGGLWAVLEIGDYYGRFLEFGKVHDVHTTFLIGLPGFGDLVRTIGRLGGDSAEER